MSRLEITTLGAVQTSLDGRNPVAFRTDKVRALLVFLAVEAHRPHRREALAGMFWPERPEAAARNNLRQALYQLREAIGDAGSASPLLRVTPHEIQFDPASDYRLDVKQFLAHLAACQAHHPGGLSLCESCLGELRAAVALYGGDFLAGFSLPGCSQFEWWQLSQQELYHRRVLEALGCLGSYYESSQDYHQAATVAQKKIELEPWRETAHRRLMRALALSGQRAEALRQYESCRAILAEEMGIEPSTATTDLYELIRLGDISGLEAMQQPKVEFGTSTRHTLRASPSKVTFVGFEPELAQLERHLEAALSSRGQVIFITGEAGSGKTTMLAEFIRRALATHGDLLVTAGGCNAQFGYGDPYLPFRQALRGLTGDSQSNRALDGLGKEWASRVWSAWPIVLEALLAEGPELVGTLLPLEALFQHTHRLGEQATGAIAELKARAARRAGERSEPGSQSSQVALCDQFTCLLLAIARRYPLILALDDLQWADRGSLSLLFHLARSLRGSRILVLCALRPEEIALEQGGERHPVQTLVNELQALSGEPGVNLSLANGWDFVNALLDRETNVLDLDFRLALYDLTEGHPLFTVEQLRGMQESGGLARDDAGRWVAGENLDWERIPARVEAVIAERLARPAPECRTILEAASVQGETFSVEPLAGILEASEASLIGHLSGELCRQHRLVFAEGVNQVGDLTRTRYRFRHALYQRQLYQSLDAVRRARLHRATGEALESRYTAHAEDFTAEDASASRLAYHFESAGIGTKAIHYHQQAGKRAYRLGANEDAISHYQHALALLQNMPAADEQVQQEMLLLISLSEAVHAARGYADPELPKIFKRAGDLAAQSGDVDLVSQALFLRGAYHFARAEYQHLLDTAEQLLTLCRDQAIPWIADRANFLFGVSYLGQGALSLAQGHLQKINANIAATQVSDTSSTADRVSLLFPVFLSWTLWLQGYPDQALTMNQELITTLRRVNHPYLLVFSLGMSSCLIHAWRADFKALHAQVRELIALAEENKFRLYQAWGEILLGWLQVQRGSIEPGLANLQAGLESFRAAGHLSFLTLLLALQAEAYTLARKYIAGFQALSEAFNLADETGERFYEAELHRLRGELLLAASGAEEEAEACFQKALQIARRQEARSLELRAAASLANLRARQGKASQAITGCR